MAQDVHYHAGGYVLDQQQRRTGMTPVVEALMGQPRLLQQCLEAARDVARVQWGAVRRGED